MAIERRTVRRGAAPDTGGPRGQNGVGVRRVHSEGKMQVTRLRTVVGALVLALAVLFCVRLNAGVTASISGTVTDASGAAVAGATVTAANVDTGVAFSQSTNGQGYYSFQSLPLG